MSDQHNDLALGILDELRQPDRRPVSEWAADGNIILPHSKRCREFRLDTAPWLIEPLDSIVHNECTSVCKCTQGGGTTLYEVFTGWVIANAPVDASLVCQTDPDAERIFEEKLLPTLKASPATAAALAAAGRNDVTKNKLKLGNMTFRVHGCGKNSLQSASLEVTLGDECWLFPLGTILEIIERTSTREATRKIIMVSQAGEELTDKTRKPCWDEWGNWWHQGTQEIYNVRCPHCSRYFEIETSHVTCSDDARDPQTKVWDWTEVRATAKLTTPCCSEVIKNTEANRRSLSNSGRYIATNPNPSLRHRSFRFSAWVVYWQDWGRLLEQFLRAQEALRQGNIEPLKIFTQKKEARWWTLKQREIPVLNTRPSYHYTKADYEPKDDVVPRWEKELHRIITVDMQANHFVLAIRVWAADGSSRLIWEGTVGSWDAIEDMRIAYRVPRNLVGVDANNWTQAVYQKCVKMKYVALHGMSAKGFTRFEKGRKFNMPWEAIEGRNAFIRKGSSLVGCRAFNFSNRRYKDQLALLAAGKALPWEHPDDVRQAYIEGLVSEAKNTAGDWVEVRPDANHPWDTEVMQLLMASLPGVEVLRYEPEPEEDEKPA